MTYSINWPITVRSAVPFRSGNYYGPEANSELTTLLLPYYLAKSECSAMQLHGKVSKIKVVQTLAAYRLNGPRQTDKNTSPLLF